MTQIVINFSRDFAAKVSPLVINFGDSSGGGGNPTDPTDDLNTKNWLIIESNAQYSQHSSLAQEFAFNYRIQQQFQIESALKWQQKKAVKREWQTKYSLLAATQTERELIYLQLSKLETDYQIYWASQSKQKQNEFTLYFGPRDAEYICMPTKHPAPGVIYLSLDRPASNKQNPLSITLNDIAKVCYWSDVGLIRAFDDIPTIDRKVPIEPQIQSVYIMQPTITCERVSDAKAIYISSFSWSKGRGQFAATCNLTFQSKMDYESALDNLLKVAVNGYAFYTLVEAPSKALQFNNSQYSATGRSRFAELSEPYKRKSNYINLVDKTHAGICSDVLQNTGWALNYSMVDYPVPAEVFSFENQAPANALNAIAASIGAMLDVDEQTKTVNVVPKWPVNPWAVNEATPDVILNDSLITAYSDRKVTSQNANAVFVSGSVQCKIKLNGTAGDLLAPQVVHDLITHNQAARQRGTCELANAGNKEVATIETALKHDLPPIMPGMLVGVQYPNYLYKSTCDKLTVSATVSASGAVTVNQTIEVLRNA